MIPLAKVVEPVAVKELSAGAMRRSTSCSGYDLEMLVLKAQPSLKQGAAKMCRSVRRSLPTIIVC